MIPKEFARRGGESNRLAPMEAHFIDAFFIGFLVGIIIFGFVTNFQGFLAIIPLFLIYLFLKKPKQQEAMKRDFKNEIYNKSGISTV